MTAKWLESNQTYHINNLGVSNSGKWGLYGGPGPKNEQIFISLFLGGGYPQSIMLSNADLEDVSFQQTGRIRFHKKNPSQLLVRCGWTSGLRTFQLRVSNPLRFPLKEFQHDLFDN